MPSERGLQSIQTARSDNLSRSWLRKQGPRKDLRDSTGPQLSEQRRVDTQASYRIPSAREAKLRRADENYHDLFEFHSGRIGAKSSLQKARSRKTRQKTATRDTTNDQRGSIFAIETQVRAAFSGIGRYQMHFCDDRQSPTSGILMEGRALSGMDTRHLLG